MRKIIPLLILLSAYILLVPGLSQPMVTLTGAVDKGAMAELSKRTIVTSPEMPSMIGNMAARMIDHLQMHGSIEVYEKSRSIIGTVRELFDAQSYLVAFLIALFSIVVPVTKGLLLVTLYFIRQGQVRDALAAFINIIGKWSMADVFVVAIFVAYLAANATQHTEELFTLHAEFGPGFYYFLGYCLLSILANQLFGAVQRL